VEELQRLKLSRRKAEYIQGIAAAALGESNGLEALRQLPDAEVVEQLRQLRGVGPWTAQWVLIRALDRPDAFPLGDLALRRTVSQLYFNGADLDDTRLEEFSRRWSPWRTCATIYLFTALRAGMV
jgi:DNA-3-methyladenine glycosylase II